MDYEGVVLTHFGMEVWQACSNVCNCSKVNLEKKNTMLIIFNWHCSEIIWKSNMYSLKIMFSRLEIVFSFT